MSLPPNLCGVLEGSRVEHVTRLEVHKVHHHGRRARVDGQAQNPAPVGVDPFAVEVHVVASAHGERFELHISLDGPGEDARLPAQDCELNVGAGVDHAGLAGQPVAVPQKGLRLGEPAQRAHAAPHVHDAFVALAGAAARCRHPDLQGVGIVEDALPDGQVELTSRVAERGHAGILPPGRPPQTSQAER